MRLVIANSYPTRTHGIIVKYCEQQRQHRQYICTELHLFSLVITSTPADEELEKLGIDIAKDWMKLGRRLVCHAKLQEIDQGYEQLSEKGYHMLKHWKQSQGTAATYQALCNGLKHALVKRQDLAEKFCYIKGN